MNIDEFREKITSSLQTFDQNNYTNANGDIIHFDSLGNTMIKLKNINSHNDNLTFHFDRAYNAYNYFKNKNKTHIKRSDLESLGIKNCKVLVWMLLIANAGLGRNLNTQRRYFSIDLI